MSTPDDDPFVNRLRDQISDNDLRIIELINKRVMLVDELWRHKAERGMPMYSPEREQSMLALLSRANEGPLSEDALVQIYRAIVATTKREAAQRTGQPDAG